MSDRIRVEMFNAAGVKRTRSSNHSMHFVAFAQQQFGQVRTVLQFWFLQTIIKQWATNPTCPEMPVMRATLRARYALISWGEFPLEMPLTPPVALKLSRVFPASWITDSKFCNLLVGILAQGREDQSIVGFWANVNSWRNLRRTSTKQEDVSHRMRRDKRIQC